MWRGHSISVVLPAYNEEPNIASAVRDFKSLDVVDEVLVVDNNSKDQTFARASEAGATVLRELKQGYGHAIRRGLAEAKGDLIVVCEPDATFQAGDLWKFLAYCEDFDLILGTRTSRALIGPNANMGSFIRIGNWVVAKLLSWLYGGPSLTDVGCTYRLIRRDALRRIEGQFRVGANHFSPEMMLVAIRNDLRVVEIPVHYGSRVGVSKITGSPVRAFRLGLRMIFLILTRRVTA